ncbi:MAG: hypothetical protein WC291_10255 [Thermodesulfovibrionales bacterium]|jgi:quinol-cytochrome oxidoreductase complex cytochrome b subunit
MGEEKKGEMKQGRRFYPDYLPEVIFAVLVTLELIIIVSLLFPPAIGREIDLSRPFQPKPEWYFLWLFQLVKYFPGNTTVIGTVILPLFFVILLFMIPSLDRGSHGKIKALAGGAILLFAFIILTILSLL